MEAGGRPGLRYDRVTPACPLGPGGDLSYAKRRNMTVSLALFYRGSGCTHLTKKHSRLTNQNVQLYEQAQGLGVKKRIFLK